MVLSDQCLAKKITALFVRWEKAHQLKKFINEITKLLQIIQMSATDEVTMLVIRFLAC